MEVGAVKQAFNNEVIQLKKNLNQAKIQLIHKLTRKAKTLTEKKTADHLKEKNKRKAESAVKEVLIMKKLKPRDIARFIITYKGDLNSHLNKPVVDSDKACARLLLHKSLQQKYKSIKGKFGDIPIKDLLMSRQERIKLKKEAKDAQKNKKKGGKVVNSEGDWNVEDVNMDDGKAKNKADDRSHGDESDGDDNETDQSELLDQDISDDDDDNVPRQVVNGSDESSVGEPENDIDSNNYGSEDENMEEDEHSDNDDANSDDEEVGKILRLTSKQSRPSKTHEFDDDEDMEKGDSSDHEDKNSGDEDIATEEMPKPKQANSTKQPKFKPIRAPIADLDEILSKIKPKKKPDKKVKENKNKNLNEKMLNRKFKKGADDSQNAPKIVDPFFKTATGENYMSLAEPRQPDEVKEVHRQGNRQERRAVMFGRAPIRPRRDQNFRSDKFNREDRRNGGQSNFGNDRSAKFNNRNSNFNDSKFNGRNSKFNDRDSKFNTGNSKFNDRNSKFNDRDSKLDDRSSKFNNNSKFNDRNSSFSNNKVTEPKEEKLHPSWEAKKKQSGILPFKGKKIVFDEN